MNIDPKAFFYIDGTPTKGCWVELDQDTTWDHIHQCLREALELPDDHPIDEVLCSDSQGIAKLFVAHDCFDLHTFTTWAAKVDDSTPEGAVEAYFLHLNPGVDPAQFLDAYRGEYGSRAEFAQQWFDETHGDSVKEAEAAGLVVDWDATAGSLSDDFVFVEHNGSLYIFNNF